MQFASSSHIFLWSYDKKGCGAGKREPYVPHDLILLFKMLFRIPWVFTSRQSIQEINMLNI